MKLHLITLKMKTLFPKLNASSQIQYQRFNHQSIIPPTTSVITLPKYVTHPRQIINDKQQQQRLRDYTENELKSNSSATTIQIHPLLYH